MTRDVLNLCEQKIKNAQINLIVKMPEDEIVVECSNTQISQVLLNLIGNAHDAIVSFESKWIILEFKLINNQSFVECSVTDCGNGIPKEIVEKLMQPFFTTKDVGKGTGLGLSISLGIIKAHKGKFYLDESSKNTRFVFEIPLKSNLSYIE
jgi:signal transduction histidine kinase